MSGQRMTIWKFHLSGHPGELLRIDMPRLAVVLDCQIQQNVPTLWALVDNGAEKERRFFTLLGTGWDMPPEFDGKLTHIATIQDAGFVWHVFEVKR